MQQRIVMHGGFVDYHDGGELAVHPQQTIANWRGYQSQVVSAAPMIGR